ncbi:MAG: hypothetical protein FJ270_01455 [Planctomycetes bacterium]|nr:hypothetical protein [Planctomycetota bacterium]
MDGANVKSIDAITRFKATVATARDDLARALAEADSDIDRAQLWIEREAPAYWKRQLTVRAEEVTVCKSALYRKQVTVSAKDSKPSVVDEKKALQRAQARLAEAEAKAKACKRWATTFQREVILFKGAMSAMQTVVERDLPMAVALMNRMTEALARYAAPEPVELQSMLKALQESAESTRRTGSGDSVVGMAVDTADGPGGAGVEESGTPAGDAASEGGDASADGADA